LVAAAANEAVGFESETDKVSPRYLEFLRQKGAYSEILVPLPDDCSHSEEQCALIVSQAEQELDKQYSEPNVQRGVKYHENVPHTPIPCSRWYTGKKFLSVTMSPAEIAQGFVVRIQRKINAQPPVAR
jgi:hypothetical protein